MFDSYISTLVWSAGAVLFILLSSVIIGGIARLIVRRRGANLIKQQDTFAGYAFASPWIVGFFIFVLAPVVASQYWSFTEYRLPDPPVWIGLENFVRLLTDDEDFRAALFNTLFLILLIWSCGTMMLIYLAALNSIPESFYEAADVDGASWWQKFRYVTLPLISPATFYNLIVGIIATFQLFEQPYILLRDEPTVARSGYTVVLYLWRATFRFNEIGYGAAISWILALLICIVTLIQFKFQDRWVHYDLR